MAARLTAYVVVGIVAATLIAGLIVGAQRDDNEGPVDLIVHNAKIYTADSDGTIAEAVAIRGNQILRVGGEREILRLRRPQTTTLDAGGTAVLPGFNDAHVQFIAGGLALERIELAGASTAAEIERRIRSWAEANPESPWVLGRGWSDEPFDDGLPTRQLLDAIVRDRPVQLISADGQMSWVNSAALKLARVSSLTPDPKDGSIVRDSRNEPTGILKQAAMLLVGRLVPPPGSEQRARALRAAVAEAHRYGVTSVQNAGEDPADFAVYEEARRTGDLNVRVYSAARMGDRLTEADVERLEAIGKLYPDDPLFKTGAVQIDIDGGIKRHAAALIVPYDSAAGSGDPAIAPDDLNRMVRLIDAAGWQIMTAAAGDRAVRMALNAYAHAARSNRAPHRGRRHRVEHAEITGAIDAARFGALGVIASMQPFLGSPSEARTAAVLRDLGPERDRRAWAYGSIAAASGRLAFGSGWPAASLNPMLGLHVAVTRTTPDGLPEGGWHPEQRVGLKAAVDAYTSGAAWASFDDQRKGTIAAGMLADLVVLSEDIFDAPPSALASTRVVMTIFDGKVVYRSSDRKGTN